jgi:hypothetical protein
MDKWEEMMEKMQDMSEEERGKQTERLKSMCICRNCPSYLGTGEAKVLFCSIGKSSMITMEKGCVCGGCPVFQHMGLTNLYYCTKGSEAEIRKK